MDRLRRHHRAPAGLARGPRRERARRSWSSAAGPPPSPLSPPWPGRPPTSPCCSARPPTSPRCRRRAPSSPAAAQGPAGAAGGDRGQAGSTPSSPRPSTSSAGSTPSWSGGCCPRVVERQLPQGYDIATHFTPRYNPWDQRFCVVPDGDLFKAISDGTASVVTDTIERLHREGPSALVGAASSRPTSSSPPPVSNCSSWAASP